MEKKLRDLNVDCIVAERLAGHEFGFWESELPLALKWGFDPNDSLLLGQLLDGQLQGGISGRRDGGLLWHAVVLWHNNFAKRTLLVRRSFQRCQLRCDNAAWIRSAKVLNRGNAGLADVKFHESRHRAKR